MMYYWKGIYGHATADFIAGYYGCEDPYMVTEMEDMAMHNLFDAGSIVITAILDGSI